jgi:ornithine decarboxylase
MPVGLSKTIWTNASEFFRVNSPDHPVMFFSPDVLQARAHEFKSGFPGLVTYAVKANPDEAVISNLVAAGIHAFDVASPNEMALIRQLAPNAVMHYNNPVRLPSEIAAAVGHGVTSYSVDSHSELDKLAQGVNPAGIEIAVRFKLPVAGAAYDFGAKFGAMPAKAVELLRRVATLGFQPSLTFHPGTQCTDAGAWVTYIHAAGDIVTQAGVGVVRLNVGGGFPSHRLSSQAPDLGSIFRAIKAAALDAFGQDHPALICEPGRAMVAESFALATRVKAIRDGEHVFLNDGIYGGLAEMPLMGVTQRIDVLSPDGHRRHGEAVPRVVFGPTCDSVDCLPGPVALPCDMAEGDYVLMHGAGAYTTATVTRFNGYGEIAVETICSMPGSGARAM